MLVLAGMVHRRKYAQMEVPVPQQTPRGAVYRRHGLLPRAPHTRLLPQRGHNKRGESSKACGP